MLNKIKTMLGQITPGPWEYSYEFDDIGPRNDNHGDFAICKQINFYENGRFIASSPEMLQWAVQEIERLRTALERMDDSKNPMMPRSEMARLVRQALGDPPC